MNPNCLFEQLIAKKDLSAEQMRAVIQDCISGALNEVQVAAFLALMRMKGETVEELTEAAKIMQGLAHKIDLGDAAIDLVGTGGDGANTFNVSTACSFVVAASGVPVAKHGSRSVSSSSGSADVLEQAGFVLNLSPAQIQRCFHECNLAFLFAPHYHPALQAVKTARQLLGIRTLFNLLGPLLNPAQVKKQMVGVYSKSWIKPLAQVLAQLGTQQALVLSAQDGLDEISIAAPTDLIEYQAGVYKAWQIRPEDYGMKHQSLEAVTVSSPQQSLALIQEVFAGIKGAARDMILLNSAAALYFAQQTNSFSSALELAKETIDRGKAAACFNQLKTLTQSFSQETNHG